MISFIQLFRIPQNPLRNAARLSALAAALCLCSTTNAATATGIMSVTATVASTCIVGTSTLAFGSTSSTAILADNIDAVGAVSVNCTNGSVYTVALGIGIGAGATFPIRNMTSGEDVLNYTVYTEAAHTNLWGDGTSGSQTVEGTGTGLVQSISAYGRIFSGQNAPAASYTDTISVSVSY